MSFGTRLLRHLVLKTSVGPIRWFYLGVYRLVIYLAVVFFRSFSCIQAVYLRRGCAKGQTIPGISDIDFAVVGERISNNDQQRICAAYRWFRTLTVLPDAGLEVYDSSSLSERSRNPRKYYRVFEALEVWQLLWGKEYRGVLERPSAEELRRGIFEEFKVWWTVFVWAVIQHWKDISCDSVKLSSVCYKTAAEVLRLDLAYRFGELTFSRVQALRSIESKLPADKVEYIAYIKKIAEGRFLDKLPGIEDRTLAFLLAHLSEIQQDREVDAADRIPLRIDAPRSEWRLNPAYEEALADLSRFAENECPRMFLGASIALNAYYPLEGAVLFIALEPSAPASCNEMLRFYSYYQQRTKGLSSQPHLYFLLPYGAFQIDVDYHHAGWQSMFDLYSHPEVFSVLSRAECLIGGLAYCPPVNLLWGRESEAELLIEQGRLFNVLRNGGRGVPPSRWLREFWRVLQIELILNSREAGEVCYPLTMRAVERAIARQEGPFPELLSDLSAWYQQGTVGDSQDYSSIFSEATEYLKLFAGNRNKNKQCKQRRSRAVPV